MYQLLLTLVVAIAVTQVAVFSTTIYLHRVLAHRSLEIHPVLDMFFRVVLWITTGQKRQEWVAVHRKHHTFTDRAGDPHSPIVLGFWRVQIGNVYYYSREARNPETVRKFASDIASDWADRHIFSHTIIGPLAGMGLLFLFFGWWGIAMGLLHALLYVFVVAPLINGLSHWSGEQNFTNNTAYNRRWLSWLTGGETLHNNHHHDPRAPKFSVHPNEFDPAWPVIKLLAVYRLAKPVKTTKELIN